MKYIYIYIYMKYVCVCVLCVFVYKIYCNVPGSDFFVSSKIATSFSTPYFKGSVVNLTKVFIAL